MWSYGGLVVVVFGFGLRQWSIFLLKHFFTPAITFQKNHILIKKGPYKYGPLGQETPEVNNRARAGNSPVKKARLRLFR